MVVVIALVVVPLLTIIFSLIQQKLYAATPKVLLSRQNLANSLTGTPDANLQLARLGDFARYAQSQASLAKSPAIATGVLAATVLRDRTPTKLLDPRISGSSAAVMPVSSLRV